MEILDGRPVARALRERARAELERYVRGYSTTPQIALVLVGDDPSAHSYCNAIKRAARQVEMPVVEHALPATIDQEAINALMLELNRDDAVSGVLVLQPLPPHLDRHAIADLLDPMKDIDGITTWNAGRLFHDDFDVLAPSTPAGGMALLKHYQIPINGRHAVIVGRSTVVGKPMTAMLLAENATVTTCHSRSRDLPSLTRQGDIVVVAVGRRGLVTAEWIKPGATVIDFGVNVGPDGIAGDVDAESVAGVAGGLTPVPNGTGRVTTAVLLRNTIKAATMQQRRRAAPGTARDMIDEGDASDADGY